jgi:hypothetical protein
VPGTGLWSVGATVLTDAADGAQGIAPNTLAYDFPFTTANTITAVISQVIINQQGDVSYSIAYPATANTSTVFNAAPGVIHNVAHYTYGDGGTVPVQKSGDAIKDYTLAMIRTMVIDDIGSSTDSDGQHTVGNSNDTVTAATASQNGSVWFDNVIHNTGNVSDQYQITIAQDPTNPFPAGSTFEFYKDNGSGAAGAQMSSVPYITDSVAAGASYHVWMKVLLPPSAVGSGIGGNGYKLSKTAASINGGNSDSVTDKLVTITPSGVDITNGQSLAQNANAPGKGAGPEVNPVTVTAASNASPAYFTLWLNNTAGNTESYTLDYSATTAFGPSAALPAGWTVGFFYSNGAATDACSSGNLNGAVASNITTLVAGGTGLKICAVVTPPVGAPASANYTPPAFPADGINVYFKATGTITGAMDVKHDMVAVTAGYNITLTLDQSGQVVPNGSKVYTHQLCNKSNTAIAKTAGDILLGTTGDTAGFTSIIYSDPGLTTVLSDLNTLVGGSGLAQNACITIYVKVTAPSGPLGATTSSIIQVKSHKSVPVDKVVAFNTDITTIQVAQLTITKYQAVAACNANPKTLTTFTTQPLAGGANPAYPGACIHYMLVINNSGNQVADSVAITDTMPNAYAIYNKGLSCYATTTTSVITVPGGTAGASIWQGAMSGNDPVTSLPYGGAGLGAAQSATINPEPGECSLGQTLSFNGFSLGNSTLATMFFRVQIMQ